MKFIHDDGEITLQDVQNDYPGKFIVEVCEGWAIFDCYSDYVTWCKQV